MKSLVGVSLVLEELNRQKENLIDLMAFELSAQHGSIKLLLDIYSVIESLLLSVEKLGHIFSDDCQDSSIVR